ncbi:C39 family peptidase [Streptomyces sp. NPDC086549]|uniref:C39 family peptidase n=1 Tax=Streptomyces sp. NPDC086549 TaxID=3365752 RepID=UPI00380E03E3
MMSEAHQRTSPAGKRRRLLTISCALAATLLSAGIATGPAFAADDSDSADDTDASSTEMATTNSISGALLDDGSVTDSTTLPVAKAIALVREEAELSDDDGDSDAAVAASTTFKTLSITTQMQQKAYWCGPAAGRATLTAFGVTKSQSTLASDMKTNSNGTYASKIPAVLRNYESRNPYLDTTGTSSAKNLFARLKTDVNTYKAPMIPLVEGYALPLWKRNGFHGMHFITLYGYGSDGVTIKYFDPVDENSLYGRHTVNRKDVYTAMNASYTGDGKADNELVW